MLIQAISCCHFFTPDNTLAPTNWNANLGYISVLLLILGLVDIENIYEFSIGSLMLKRKIKEADSILDHLRELITPVSEVAMTVAARSNRIGMPPIEPGRLRHLKEKMEDELKKIYLPEEIDSRLISKRKQQLNEIFIEYHKFNLWDLAQPIFSRIRKDLNIKEDEIRKEMELYKQPITVDEKWKKLNNTLQKINSTKQDLKEINKKLKFSDFKPKIIERINNIPDDVFNAEEKNKIICAVNPDIEKIQQYKKEHAID